MGQNEGNKCQIVHKSSIWSKRQKLTTNAGYPLLEILPVTDTSEILSRAGFKSVGNAHKRGFEQVGIIVHTVGIQSISYIKLFERRVSISEGKITGVTFK